MRQGSTPELRDRLRRLATPEWQHLEQVEFRIETLPAVHADAELLRQVFVNLLANAIEYSPSGGTVEIATLGDAGRWVVRVIDHGTGLHAEEAERVFERFFRADESRVTATGGHGLGLAICRSIMRGHRGDVVYSPTPGGGATFEVRFDAAVPAVA